MAAMYDFRSVTGIEVSRTLHDVSLRNAAIMRAQGVMKCEPQLLNMDVLKYQFPKAPLLLYAYNPFKRKTMGRFVERLTETHRVSPRHIVLAYRIPYRYAACARVLEEHPMFTEVALSTRLPKYLRVFEIAGESVQAPSRLNVGSHYG
jgi:hypothetical protein